MKCPSCGVDASGKFCASCGSPLRTKKCTSCGAAVAPGSRFCNGCGTVVPGGGGPKKTGTARPGSGQGASGAKATASGPDRSSNLAWWVAGALLLVVLFALGYPALTRETSPAGGGLAPAGMGSGAGTAGAVDLTTMTLEEQGTILFNRVMTSSSAGDTADVAFFQPKAIVIYQQLAPTDPDGLYHFALLHQVGGDFEAALAKAQEGLTETPDYLLLLAVAAEASTSLGDEAGARDFYSHFLDVYDTEMGLMRPGYEHHQTIFPVYRDEAQAFLNAG